MTAATVDAVIALGGAISVLLVLIVLQRAVRRLQLRRDRVERPAYQRSIARFLADESADAPPRPDRHALRMLREVATDALMELRGAERERLTAYLEASGVVEATARELRARRRAKRRKAADMLAEMRSSEAKVPLVRGLGDADETVRLGCARALAELGDESTFPMVLRTVEKHVDRSPGAASDVLLALAAKRPRFVADVVWDTSSPRLRRQGVTILGELRLAEHAPLLREMLRDESDETVRAAARGLGLIGDVVSVEPLLGVLGDSSRSDSVHETVARSLGWIGDRRAVPWLRGACRSPRWAVSRAAAVALVELGEPAEEPVRQAAAASEELPAADGALVEVRT